MILNLKKITGIYLITVILALFLLLRVMEAFGQEQFAVPFTFEVNRLIFILLTVVCVNYMIYYEEIFNISELTFSNNISYFKIFVNKLLALCILSFIYMFSTTLLISLYFDMVLKTIIILSFTGLLYTIIVFQIIIILYFIKAKYIISIILSIVGFVILPNILQLLKFSSNELVMKLGNYNIITLLYDSIYDVMTNSRYIGLVVSYIVLLIISVITRKLYIKKM